MLACGYRFGYCSLLLLCLQRQSLCLPCNNQDGDHNGCHYPYSCSSRELWRHLDGKCRILTCWHLWKPCAFKEDIDLVFALTVKAIRYTVCSASYKMQYLLITS